MAKRRSPKRGSPKRRSAKRRSAEVTMIGGTGDIAADAATGASNISSRLKAKAIDKTTKLPDQIVKRHQDKSLYVLLLILSLFCVNLYFFVKNVMGKSLHEKDALKNMGQDERKKADEEDEALKSAVEFYNNITTAIHSAFLMGNILAISKGSKDSYKIHTTYYITLGLVIINLALSLITTYTLHISFATKTQGFIYFTALVNILLFAFRKTLANSSLPAAGAANP